MSQAWSTVVHREPEWDATSRSLAIGAVMAEQVKCPQCGNTDTVVEVRTPDKSAWVWPARGEQDQASEEEQVFVIRQYRCVACAGIAVRQRAVEQRAKALDASPERVHPTDAIWHQASRHIPRPEPEGR